MHFYDLPDLNQHLSDFKALLQNRHLALFLDYDGTLTPIVSRPEDAIIHPEMKETVYELSKLVPVAIISGRDRKDVQNLVGLKSLIYSGSHGFDTASPEFEKQHEAGVACLPQFNQAEEQLKEALAPIENAHVERKLFAIAIHYRNVEEQYVQEVEGITNRIFQQFDCFKKAGGKKIIELKPDIDWHKGKALLWLLQKLDLQKESVLPVYIGDDVTDEDAFGALPEVNGIGILVGDHEIETKANYRLDTVDQVQDFLKDLVKYFKDKSN